MDVIDSEELRKAVASNVLRLRTARGWSQSDLAERLQISTVMLSRIENCKSLPGAELLYSLADAFGVPADTFRQVSENFASA